jgi:gliding motility-associated-like protein
VGIDNNPAYENLVNDAEWYLIKEPKPSYCGGPNGEIYLFPPNDSLTNNYMWLDSLNSTFISNLTADFKTGLMPGIYSFWASAKSLVPPDMNIYCKDTFEILIKDTGYIGPLFKLDNLLDTAQAIASDEGWPIKFDNLTFLGDTVVFSQNGMSWAELAQYPDPVPAADQNDAQYEWTFYLLPFDAVPPTQYPDPVLYPNNVINPWEDPENDLTTNDVNPTVKLKKPGWYKIRLRAASSQGCENEIIAAWLKNDEESNIEPGVNFFTPNGDGENDYLEFEAATIKSMHGQIFNRWGKMIYEWTWNEADQKPVPGWWDGKVNSKDAAPGVYFYFLTGVGRLNDKQFCGKEYVKAFHLIREKK